MNQQFRILFTWKAEGMKADKLSLTEKAELTPNLLCLSPVLLWSKGGNMLTE